MTTSLDTDDRGWGEFYQGSGERATIEAATTGLVKIIDAIGIPVVVLRRDLVLACFNRAAADVLRLAPSEIGRSPSAIPILSGLQNLDRWCAQVISADVPTQHDIRIADKSFIARIAPYKNRQFSGAVLTFTNVTAFRASIDQAIYEREYAKAILNTVAEPLVVLGADLRVLTANRAFYSLLRTSPEAVRGVPLDRVSDGALDLPRLATQLKETLADGLGFRPLEMHCDWPGVGRRIMSLYACPLALPGHPTRMALLSFHDITARKEAEATNSRLAAIVEYSDDAIVTIDLNGVITSWNKGAQRIFGYAEDDLIGKPITLLVPVDRQSEEVSIFERIGRGQRVESYDTVRQRKDGTLV